MSLGLTISRYGLMPVTPILQGGGGLENGELVSAFRRQTELFVSEELLKPANAQVLKIADGRPVVDDSEPFEPPIPNKLAIVGMPLREDEDGSDAGNAAAAGTQRFETLVGLLPFQEFRCDVDGVDWIVRTRASMTSCALQKGNRQTKLWWTFEGIPVSAKPPNEEQAAAFVKRTDQLEECAMPLLRDAYLVSLQKLMNQVGRFDGAKERIRISLSDNDDRPIGELLGAIRHKDLSTIEDKGKAELKWAREGLRELERFVGAVTEQRLSVGPETLRINSEIPGIKGILCRQEGPEPFATLLAGFARRAAGSGGFHTRPEEWPDAVRVQYIRRISPARQLSARLANSEAHSLEERLGWN